MIPETNYGSVFYLAKSTGSVPTQPSSGTQCPLSSAEPQGKRSLMETTKTQRDSQSLTWGDPDLRALSPHELRQYHRQ